MLAAFLTVSVFYLLSSTRVCSSLKLIVFILSAKSAFFVQLYIYHVLLPPLTMMSDKVKSVFLSGYEFGSGL